MKTFETLLAEYDEAHAKTVLDVNVKMQLSPNHGEWLRKRVELVAMYREERYRATAYAEAFEPGKASGIIGGMFKEAEKRGHSPIAAQHALGFLLRRLDVAEKLLRELCDNFGSRVADILIEKDIEKFKSKGARHGD